MVNDGDIQRHMSPPATDILIGHAGASATLWWSVQLNLLGGTWKGQSFLATIALERKQGSWVKERNITNVPAKRQATEHSCNRRQRRIHMKSTITNTLVIGNLSRGAHNYQTTDNPNTRQTSAENQVSLVPLLLNSYELLKQDNSAAHAPTHRERLEPLESTNHVHNPTMLLSQPRARAVLT